MKKTAKSARKKIKALSPRATTVIRGGENASPMDPLINTAGRNGDKNRTRR
jgi:hypothetical protein